ncbi:MAG: CapA family protein [Leptospirales bacterium]|nr:CapA family protein [Leptospirales bacterium]
MNNIKTYKKFISILVLLLIASCSLNNIKSIDDKSAIDKIDSTTKENSTEDSDEIFIHHNGDSENISGINNKKEPATITAVGDVILNLALMKTILDNRNKKYGKKDAMIYPFSKVKKEMIGIGFCNLEAPITDLEHKYFSDKDEVFYFNSPGGSEEILKYGGLNVVSLANNHVMDTGKAGMLDTRKRLKEMDIISVGVGNNIDEALKPVYINDKGTVIAIFAFSTVIPKSVWAGPDKAGTAGGSSELLIAAVKKVSRKADAVFVSIHWGEESDIDSPVKEPDREQIELAYKLIDAGVTCIVGHHSHALGFVERYKGGVIFYSLGDFVFAGRHSESHTTSIMAQISLSRSGLESYTLIPVNINPLKIEYSPEILDEKRGREVINRILIDDSDSKYLDYYKKIQNTILEIHKSIPPIKD